MSRPSSRLLATATSRIPSSSCPCSHTPLLLLRPATTTITTTTTTTTTTGRHRNSSRPFSQTCARPSFDSLLSRLGKSEDQQRSSQQQQQQQPPARPAAGGMTDISRILTEKAVARGPGRSPPSHQQQLSQEILSGSSYSQAYLSDLGLGGSGEGGEAGAEDGQAGRAPEDLGPANEPFHFHVYAHKHNCHITVTKPNRGAVLSLSAGNIGFRKSKRGTYDAAYQLTAYVMDKLNQGGWHKIIRRMEVVLRGFGSGREAATKVLLGAEGKMIRHTIVKVSDATRLKFGGTRSPNPRRLG